MDSERFYELLKTVDQPGALPIDSPASPRMLSRVF